MSTQQTVGRNGRKVKVSAIERRQNSNRRSLLLLEGHTVIIIMFS